MSLYVADFPVAWSSTFLSVGVIYDLHNISVTLNSSADFYFTLVKQNQNVIF